LTRSDAPSLLLGNVRVDDEQTPQDILIVGGVISSIGESEQGVARVDGRGGLVIPALVDSHAHLDTTLWGNPWRPHTGKPGDISLMIENERTNRRTLDPVAVRIGRLIKAYEDSGTLYVRSHIQVDPEVGLTHLEGIMSAVAESSLTVEIVAFPQMGVLREPGTEKLLQEAVNNGAHRVGGIDPAGWDRDPVRHIDIVFGIADRTGCGIDIHLHDGGELGAFELSLIIERTRSLGMAGKVTVSHCFCLAEVSDSLQGRLITQMADAGVSLATVAPGNRVPLPLRRLAEHGVDVGLGHDGTRDLWWPYGNGDLLERAMIMAYRSGFRTDEDLALAFNIATYGGARVLNLEGYGVKVGARADLVVVQSSSAIEAVVAHPARSVVIGRGRLVRGMVA
jgi:cytosine deaminase